MPRVVGSALAASLLLAAPAASADGVGYQLDRYEPTPAGDSFMIVEAPWYAASRWFAGGLTFDYAHNLLTAQHVDASGNIVTDPAPIASSSAAHLDLAGSPIDGLAVSLSVPLVLDQTGTAFAGVGPSGTTAGDPRIGARVRIHDGALAVSASAYLWIPIGVEDKLAGDASVRGLGRITVGGAAGDHLRWAANGSLLARETAVVAMTTAPGGNTTGSEVQLSAAAGYGMAGDRLTIGPEVLLSISLVDLPAPQHRATLEAYATGHYQIDDSFAVGLGAGTGVAGGPGPPDVRVLASIVYAPVRPRGSSFERVIVLPDENGHVGAVEVDDGKHKTLLDRAYASTEISRKSGAAREVQATPSTLPPAAAELAAALPPSDRDGDGVIDANDGCPDRAGAASPDPIRNGCPPSAEKVVVLPDADGHVGGVEIDDGHGKTVLDTAYATAEVGGDGRVETVAPAASKTVEQSIAALAQTLPPPDADGDGILDLSDACPDRAGAASSDPLRNGCPAAAERVIVVPGADGHVGAVEVDDGHAVTLIDHAYGSVDVGADGVAHAVAPTQARSVEHALSQLAAALPIVDGDGDGVPDDKDACPELAGVASPDPLRDGCPKAEEKVIVVPDADGHVGAVEVDDGTQKVLVDAAYASAEVAGGKVHASKSTPSLAVVHAAAALASALPEPDRDDDGIADAVDACPDRAGPASPTPARNGCPRTVEQVVVLPDENGTVGAVEVDDGTTTTLLDKEYAAAETGIDGKAHGLTVEPTEVSAKYGAALAARPPGARIILYFTAGSEPARDLTGPIDNLVAELKAKGTYSVEVIGHTDQTGSETINVKIGRQRAQLIADRLVAAGVPADRIKVSSMGSRDPAVKRKSRKAVELRNRRVEIWVH